MIFHISIPARNPEHVANILAELWHGKAFPFPPFPGSFIAFAGDEHGTAVEVAPLAEELVPGDGEGEVVQRRNPNPSEFSATHAAVEVPISEERIKEIAHREGWRVVTCDRGPAFQVVEFWVENRFLLELLPPEFAARYRGWMNVENWAEMLALGPAA